MYDQVWEGTLFLMFYASVAMLALIACCYLLFRRGNAIAPDITPPVRLRRWTAGFFAAIALCHLWYLPTYYLTSGDDIMRSSFIAGLLESMTVIPSAIVILHAMLQDHRRPLWPVAVMVAPLIVGLAWCVATRSDALLPALFVYFLLMLFGLLVYIVRAIRQYGSWLRDNYADLEHKEVWQSFVVLAIILLAYAIYSLDAGELIYEYATEGIDIVLICYLLWRVETLQTLPLQTLPLSEDFVCLRTKSPVREGSNYPVGDDSAAEVSTPLPYREGPGEGLPGESLSPYDLPLSIRTNIGPLLKQHCEDTQLYLQYDISITQLATLIGINRSYLSKHFAMQGITYNEYINGLRIQHFISLYHEAVATHQPVSAQQLACQSGFRNYKTFSAAFKKIMEMTATEWMQLVKS
jgi:AraC-like DNA-binding protein